MLSVHYTIYAVDIFALKYLSSPFQRFALWHTVCKVDWSNAYWGVFKKKSLSHTPDFAFVCILYTTCYILAKSVCTATVVDCLGFGCVLVPPPWLDRAVVGKLARQ